MEFHCNFIRAVRVLFIDLLQIYVNVNKPFSIKTEGVTEASLVRFPRGHLTWAELGLSTANSMISSSSCTKGRCLIFLACMNCPSSGNNKPGNSLRYHLPHNFNTRRSYMHANLCIQSNHSVHCPRASP